MGDGGGRGAAARRPEKKTALGHIEAAALDLVGAAVKAEADARSGARDLGGVEGDLRAAALSFAAKVLGTLMSGPLQQAAGVDAPSGRRGARTTAILASVGEVSYTRAHVPVTRPAANGCSTDGSSARACRSVPA